MDTNGNGHGAWAGILYGQQVDVLICGGIGGGAQMALAQAGIKLFGGVSGDVEAILVDTNWIGNMNGTLSRYRQCVLSCSVGFK